MSLNPLRPADEREAALRAWLLRASQWLLLLGAVQALQGPRLSAWLGLRAQEDALHLLRAAAAGQICLGLLANRAARRPQPQPLLVDLVGLFFILRVSFMLSLRLRGYQLMPAEWVQLGLDLGLGSVLALLRLRSSELAASRAFWDQDWAAWKLWFNDNLSVWLPGRRSAAVRSERAKRPERSEERPAAAEARQGKRSESIPHLD